MAVRHGIPILFTLLALLTGGISAAHTAPAPAVDCSTIVLSMADCLSYVTAGGTAKKPEGNCCSGLKTVLKADADCLCEAFKNSAQLGVTLNITKAMTLPSACHVSSPSLSNCALSTSPSSAPAVSPMAALSPGAAAGAPTNGIGGSEGAPAPALGSGSGSSALGASIGLIVLSAVAAVSFGLF